MELGRSGGVQGDGTDRTKTQTQFFTRFGLTWHQKVNFSEKKYWNFNVLEMVLKTFHFVPGLSRTPSLFTLRYLTNIFFQTYFPEENIPGN